MWTFSDDMSQEQKDQIQAMLGSMPQEQQEVPQFNIIGDPESQGSEEPLPDRIEMPAGAIDFSQFDGLLLGGETVIFQDNFEDSEAMQNNWKWVRGDEAAWSLATPGNDAENPAAFSIQALPGNMWDVSPDSSPVKNIVLRQEPDNCSAIEVKVALSESCTPGEQAGLLWYFDDNNYAKLVVQSTENGLKVVMGMKNDGELHDVAMGDIDPGAACLRMELSQAGESTQLTGMVDGTYCKRLIGSCGWHFGQADKQMSVGFNAHGGSESAGCATFNNFRCLQIAADRVQFGAADAGQ